MAIAWVNGVFSGLDHLRRLRRAPRAQTRTAAKPRSDHRTMQQLRQGDAERKSGERVSRPRRTRPAASGGRTSRDAVAGRPATLSPGGTPAAQAVRRAQSGVAFRPAGARRTGLSRSMPGAPRQRRARPCKLKPGDAPKYGARGRAHNASDGSAPPPAQEQGTQSAPPVSAPPSPPETDGGGSPGGMRGRGGRRGGSGRGEGTGRSRGCGRGGAGGATALHCCAGGQYTTIGGSHGAMKTKAV